MVATRPYLLAHVERQDDTAVRRATVCGAIVAMNEKGGSAKHAIVWIGNKRHRVAAQARVMDRRRRAIEPARERAELGLVLRRGVVQPGAMPGVTEGVERIAGARQLAAPLFPSPHSALDPIAFVVEPRRFGGFAVCRRRAYRLAVFVQTREPFALTLFVGLGVFRLLQRHGFVRAVHVGFFVHLRPTDVACDAAEFPGGFRQGQTRKYILRLGIIVRHDDTIKLLAQLDFSCYLVIVQRLPNKSQRWQDRQHQSRSYELL